MGEGGEGGGEIVRGVGEAAALGDGRIGRTEEGFELGFEGVEVEAAVKEPLEIDVSVVHDFQFTAQVVWLSHHHVQYTSCHCRRTAPCC